MELQKQEPRWERRKNARPQELIDAALDVFVAKGYSAARLDEVAKQAGVSKGTVYLYFTNKEELFKAVVRDSIVASIANVEELENNHRGDTPTLLRGLMREWWENICATRSSAIPKIIVSEAGNFPEILSFYHEEVIRRAERVTIKILQRGIDAGEFRPVDLKLATQLIFAPFIFICIWKYSFAQCASGAPEGEKVIDAHIDMTLRGLANGA
ncbi:MAG: TetR/AcrR family transcriptional regulator [Pseudomonadota bacterium]